MPFGLLLARIASLAACFAVQLNGPVAAREAVEPVIALPVHGRVGDADNFAPELGPKFVIRGIASTGPPVKDHDYTWQMGLQVPGLDGRTRRCGGTLVSRQFILTAAHCLDRRKVELPGPAVPFDINDVQAFRSSEQFGLAGVDLDLKFGVVLHENYKSGGPYYQYDAALLRLRQPILDATPAPVSSRTVDTSGGPVMAIVSGWGLHPDGTRGRLRAARVPIMPIDECRAEARVLDRPSFTDATICTLDAKEDACVDDSGGPLVVGTRDAPLLVGIVSFGSTRDCGIPNPGKRLVGGYTRASILTDWISRTTGDPDALSAKAPGTLMSPRSDLSNGEDR